MGISNIFILKTLLVFSIVCAVLCEHQKRDVHRIVIKQKVPRSPKKSHGHSQLHDHKRGRHNSGRSKGHDHKKEKKPLSSYEKDSSESSSYSRENSFEDVLHQDHKSYHRDSKKSHHFPSSYQATQDFGETKQIPYKEDSKFFFHNEWTPMSSEQVHYGSQESYRDRYKRQRNSRKNYITSLKPPPVDLTTSYPFQFQTSTNYPPLIDYPSAFSNFNLNKKIIESNRSPLIGTIEHPNVQFVKSNFNNLNSHKTSYEVTELTAADSNTNTFILVPDEKSLEKSLEEVTTNPSKHKSEEVKTTQKPARNRGRGIYRGHKKA